MVLSFTELGQLKKDVASGLGPVPKGAVRNPKLGFDYLVVEEKQDWEGAHQGCYSRGYGLASIESAEENKFIVDTIGVNRCKYFI